MTPQEFADFVSTNRAVSRVLSKVAASLPRKHNGFAGPEKIMLSIALFPLVRYVVINIGLPWLREVTRYTEIWRTKFSTWVSEQREKHGLEPEAAEAAAQILREELEGLTDAEDRRAWEKLADLLRQE